MKKIFPIIIILIALVAIAYYVQNRHAPVSNALNIERAASLMVGTWQSADDIKAVVVFEQDGTQRDVYDGAAVSVGAWELRDHVEEATKEYNPSGVFLHTVINGDVFEYAIVEVNETELVMSYLARGNTLRYRRVPADTSAGAVPADWREYSNEEYDFTLKYPVNWEVQEALKPQDIRAEHEVVVWEQEYDTWRASLTIRMYPRDEGQSVRAWWEAWLAEEDVKEAKCREEHGDMSPCLFLRGLVEKEWDATLAGEPAVAVELFRFDHQEECTYAAHGEYVYGICAAGKNPNDPQEAEHRTITDAIRTSFSWAAM